MNDGLLREAWKRGVLDWKLDKHQLELVQGMRTEGVELIYADFTRRGGKTYGAGVFCDSEARKQKISIRYATAFQSDLIQFIKPTFDLIEQDCPDDLRAEYLESAKVYKFPNGSEIKLVGLDKNPNGLRGNGIRIIVIDEAGFVANLKYIYEAVIVPATLRRKSQLKQPIKIIIITTPPRDATVHYAYQLKLKAQLEPNGFYMCKTIDEVDSIPDAEKERMFKEVGGKHSVTAQREFYCKWIVDEELAVCPTFDENKHVAMVFEPEYCNWSFVADTGGVRDKTVAYLVTWSHIHQKVVFWDEIAFEPKTSTSIILEGFKELIGPKEVIGRFADAPPQLLVDYSVAGFAAGLPPKDEFHAGLTMLRNAFYNDEVLIHPRCKLLIETLRSGLLNNQRTDYQRTDLLGHCDAAAAAIYGLRVVDRVTNTTPRPTKKETFAWTRQTKHPLSQLGYRG